MLSGHKKLKIPKKQNEPKTKSVFEKKEKNKGIAKALPIIKINLWREFTIRTKILIAFAIPVLLMALFGFVSYQKTSEAILDNYINSTTETLNANKDYILMGMNNISDEAYKLIGSEAVKNYYKKTDKVDLKVADDNYIKLSSEISAAKASNNMNYNIHIFGNVGNSFSTAGELPKDIYESFNKSAEGQLVTASTERFLWIGNHSYLDEMLKNQQTSYAAAMIRKLSENNGYIIIDISSSQITSTVSQVKIGNGSIVGFVTADGKEILSENDEANIFKDLSYYKEATTSSDEYGNSFEKYNGENYLFLYSKIGNTGATLCALVPKNEILKQANFIKILNFVFVLLTCALAILIGTILARGIGSEITKLTKSISLAAKGDLTTKFDTKRKDEFLILSNSLKDMMGEMRSLITAVAEVGTRVSNSANTLSGTSSDILGSTKNISTAIDEIGEGVNQQASDTEQCSNMMSDLSDQISQVYQNTYQIEQIAMDTKTIINDGIVIVDELNRKSSATTDITHVVISEIEDLEVHSQNIENIVSVINGIAEQTNLLSLNASIEAARAGDAGKGFAVVAGEIRKLADQSVKASNQIKQIVNEIQGKTQTTAKSAKEAKSIVESQMEALGAAITTFERINQHVSNLVNNLNNIADGVKSIETAKDNSMDAIRNISAVSQQTASASEEVSATAIEQINSVEYLSSSAAELAENARTLEKAILMFKVSEN